MSVRKRPWKTASGEVKEIWLVDYADAMGKRRFASFAKKKDADRYHDTVVAMFVPGCMWHQRRASPSGKPVRVGSSLPKRTALSERRLCNIASNLTFISPPLSED
jgi:hypothetical protein